MSSFSLFDQPIDHLFHTTEGSLFSLICPWGVSVPSGGLMVNSPTRLITPHTTDSFHKPSCRKNRDMSRPGGQDIMTIGRSELGQARFFVQTSAAQSEG